MRAGAQVSNLEGAMPLPDEDRKFLFTSGQRALHAHGVRACVSVPAHDGSFASGHFQRALQGAFEAAKWAGDENPIAIGAIPFDMREASCLYVPEQHEWREKIEPLSALDAPHMPLPLSQRGIPDEAGFKHSVEHAILNFGHSQVRKAVLSITREIDFDGTVDIDRLLANLAAQNADGYQFRIPLEDGSTLIGVSPELLLRKEGGRIVSNPLAGSAKRHGEPEADRLSAGRLEQSEKDHYEHRLVIEDIRRILTPLCAELNIPSAPSLISTATLWHLSTRIEAELANPQMNALQIACMLHPTPAVCGLPTEQAYKLIRFVEPFERGYFAGMVGWCDAAGNGEWVVTIRCGTVQDDKLRLFAGAGIVDASEPQSEWAEVQTKLGTMLHACGIAA